MKHRILLFIVSAAVVLFAAATIQDYRQKIHLQVDTTIARVGSQSRWSSWSRWAQVRTDSTLHILIIDGDSVLVQWYLRKRGRRRWETLQRSKR